MALKIYSTLSQKLETFEPIEKGQVKMYVCGPTVYGFLHVGNFRGPIFFNLVRNWLEKSGYKVTYVFNYTDVDDKIITRANEEKVTASEISEKYIAEFKKDFATLKLRPHDQNPKVTEYMPQIVSFVDELMKAEKAYNVGGEVLYKVREFKNYGQLSKKSIDDLQSGARVEIGEKKQDPLDFALWKPAKPGEPKWPSPWCDGRPGWHIECSAMVRSILGESIDIHGGGMDLIFPHHENEIAQSEGATGKPFAKYWMHNNMLTFGDKKMSKSLGNIVSARDFLTQYDAEIMKFMTLSVHYRSLSDFSEKGIHQAIAGLARIYSALAFADEFLDGGSMGKVHPQLEKALQEATAAARAAMDDDFNTSEVFAALYTVVRTFNSLFRHGQKVTDDVRATASAFKSWVQEWGQLMSLFQEPAAAFLRSLDDRVLQGKNLPRTTVDGLVQERTAARAAKDFAKSDELRAKLSQMGILLHDTATGTTWEVAKS